PGDQVLLAEVRGALPARHLLRAGRHPHPRRLVAARAGAEVLRPYGLDGDVDRAAPLAVTAQADVDLAPASAVTLEVTREDVRDLVQDRVPSLGRTHVGPQHPRERQARRRLPGPRVQTPVRAAVPLARAVPPDRHVHVPRHLRVDLLQRRERPALRGGLLRHGPSRDLVADRYSAGVCRMAAPPTLPTDTDTTGADDAGPGGVGWPAEPERWLPVRGSHRSAVR